MRRLALIATVTSLGLIVAGVLGAASAQAPAPPMPRTVSVQGVGTAAIDSAAGGDAASAAYRQALASAVTDGQSKAGFLAARVGGALGAVQSVGEGGGYIDCGQLEYSGTQPDFGTGPGPQGLAGAAPRSAAPVTVGRPLSGKPKPVKKRRRRRKAHAAAACTLSAQVSLIYALG